MPTKKRARYVLGQEVDKNIVKKTERLFARTFFESQQSQYFRLDDLQPLLHFCIRQSSMEISSQTMVVIPVDNQSESIIINQNQPPYLVPISTTKLMATYANQSLLSHAVKKKLLTKIVGPRNLIPIVTLSAIFTPISSPTRANTLWYNLYHLTGKQAYFHESLFFSEALLTFQNEFKLLLPRSIKAIRQSLQKDLLYASVYYQLFTYFLTKEEMIGVNLHDRFESIVTRLIGELSVELSFEKSQLRTAFKKAIAIEYFAQKSGISTFEVEEYLTEFYPEEK